MNMVDKLEGYKGKEMSEDDQIEMLETKEPELVPDGETVVPTGEEAMPMSAADPKEARKALYDKGRKNREALISREAEEVPDVARIQKLHEMAAGGKDPADGLDTNRDREPGDAPEVPDAFKEEVREQMEAEEEIPEEEMVNEEPAEATDSLPELEPPRKIEVKILGKVYEVPQQDVDDAGGLEAYQKSRAANVKLQRAATLEDRALKTLAAAQEQQEEQQEADPPSDGLGEADIDSLREEMMDTVIDGSEEDINKWIERKLRPVKASPPPAPSPAAVSPPAVNETRLELERQQRADMEETNDMMREQYQDILNDPDSLTLSRQRFNLLVSDPNNEGRSQKEMAREAAEWVRDFGRKWARTEPRTDRVEEERQTRIRRKRKLPQPSRADVPAPPAATQEKQIPTRREHFKRLRRAQGHDS